MPQKPFKSQWDFGDLFSQPSQDAAAQPGVPTRQVFSVTELTGQIKRLLEKQVGAVWVSGEITNLRAQSSGHMYFTLKDAVAQLSCVLFRGEFQVDRALLQDGRKVNLRGEVTVYEARGQYQLRVTEAEAQGIGALQAAFERLKQKLNAEGLFAPERKRPLPRYARRLGLVTSPTGAALRDVLHVIERRNPSLELVLAPCRVQGDGAAREIAAAIALLNDYHARMLRAAEASGAPASAASGLDLLLVTRGGGSLEDLWAFNEEVVARAIYHSALPVVSAVGHEIDFTISDFVADLRAATPSAAAELITEGVYSSCQFIGAAGNRIRQLARQHFSDKAAALSRAQQRLSRAHPLRKLNEHLQRLDVLQSSLARCVRQAVKRQRVEWQNLAARLSRVRPTALLKQRREVLEQAYERLREQARHGLRERNAQVQFLEARLQLLGPEQVLGRGYSITMDAKTSTIIRKAAEVAPGQLLRTRFKTGEACSRVEPVKEERK